MKKLLLFVCFSLVALSEDKPKPAPQPTLEERATLLQLQRDWLVADRQAHDKADSLEQQAQALSAKYHCSSWNPDFTCVFTKPAEPTKVESK